MPSRYVYEVKADDEIYLVAAYGREEALRMVFPNAEVEDNKKDLLYFKVGNKRGIVFVVKRWVDDSMVRKTARGYYVDVMNGYALMNEDELNAFLEKYKTFRPRIARCIVTVDGFGRRENVIEVELEGR